MCLKSPYGHIKLGKGSASAPASSPFKRKAITTQTTQAPTPRANSARGGGDGNAARQPRRWDRPDGVPHRHCARTMPPAIFRCRRREEASCKGSAGTMERADPAGSPSSQNQAASVAGDTDILTVTPPAKGEKKPQKAQVAPPDAYQRGFSSAREPQKPNRQLGC